MVRNYARSKDGDYKFFNGEFFPTESPAHWAIWRAGEDTPPTMRRIGEDSDTRLARLGLPPRQRVKSWGQGGSNGKTEL